MHISSKYRIAKTLHGSVARDRRTGIIIHHSVTAEAPNGSVEAGVQTINRIHPNGAYNFLVDRDGGVWESVGLDRIGAHAYKANTPNIGICYVGDGRYNFTDAAATSIRELCAWIESQCGKSLKIMGHRDVNSTECPGKLVYDRLGDFRGGTAPAAPSAPSAVAPPFPMSPMKYFGPRYPLGNKNSVSGFYGGKEDLKRFMQQMKNRGWDFSRHGIDGLYGDELRENTIAFQRQVGLKPDGLIGPDTWAAAWTAPIT